MTEQKAFLKLFQKDPDDLTLSEIRALLDGEMKKEAPDTELIEHCLTALEQGSVGGLLVKPKRSFRKRLVLAVAVAAVFLVAVTSVNAVMRLGAFGENAYVFSDGIRIFHRQNPTQGTQSTQHPLITELNGQGFEELLLPRILLSQEYTVTQKEYEHSDYVSSAVIRFYAPSTGQLMATQNITVFITEYSPAASLPVTDYKGAEPVTEVKTQKTTCLIFIQNGKTVMDYTYGNTVYSVLTDWSVPLAAEYAKGLQ